MRGEEKEKLTIITIHQLVTSHQLNSFIHFILHFLFIVAPMQLGPAEFARVGLAGNFTL